jgi:uncharacterized membrane protein YuzA (DUF378 family)
MISAFLSKIYFSIPVQAQCGPLGCITNPNKSPVFGSVGTIIGLFINIMVGFAGLWALVQLVLAGYMYMGSSGDPKKAETAWFRIMYSICGLVVVAAAMLAPTIISKFTGQPVDVIPTK